MNVFKTEVGGQEISIETGRMAKQANGSVVVRKGDTMVLATACMSPTVKDGQDWFPLMVEFQEKTFAAGKIPGGFFKREGRLGSHEILTSRLIDRPLRPLFPDGFMHDTQIVCTVISADKENEADTLGLIAASAALTISDIPLKEPVAAARLGRINGEFVINASPAKMKESEMNVLIAGTASSIIMVEGDAKQVDEKTMLEGLFFAHKEIQALIKLQNEMREKVGKAKFEFTPPVVPEDVISFVNSEAEVPMKAALSIKEKMKRYSEKDAVKEKVVESAVNRFCTDGSEYDEATIKKIVVNQLDQVASKIMRDQILGTKTRIDGRDLTTVRPISIEAGVLPRAHGSVLFTRGETQALVSCTLGALDDSQKIDALLGAHEKYFILHYNFPPFSVGEVKPMRGPSRRDIGHGNLAETSLAGLAPDKKKFPYTVRVVSEILESNGSSSMATVCGGSLAMMDAGVPLAEPVAGIAMGLVAEDDKMEVLTDILGDEDHLGDMDFKVTGTKTGITGFQLDTKISGISMEIMEKALHQARDARLYILDKMAECLSEPRAELAPHAPKLKQIKVRQNKIKDVIGPGGKNIKGVVEATGAKVEIADDGTVSIFSSDVEMVDKAVEMVEALGGEIEVGRIYKGQVRKVVDFGAFVNIAPGTDGLVHISELSEERVKRVEDVLQEGDECDVKVLDIDRQGRIRLSLKEAVKEKAAG